MARNTPAPTPAEGLMAEIRKIPPVTRTLVIATISLTLPVLLELLDIRRIAFSQAAVWQGQIWRIPSSFFFGGRGIGFIFDLVMLYRNSDALETVWYHRRSADYAWHLLLAGVGILALNIPLGTPLHYRALLGCVVYLPSRLDPDAQVSIFGLLNVKAMFFPFVLVGLDLLNAGVGAAMVTLTGVLVSHLWYVLEWQERGPTRPGGGTGAVLGRAPWWMKKLVGVEEPPTVQRSYGSASHPRREENPAQHNWGRGSRLGTD